MSKGTGIDVEFSSMSGPNALCCSRKPPHAPRRDIGSALGARRYVPLEFLTPSFHLALFLMRAILNLDIYVEAFYRKRTNPSFVSWG
jgi:hypothetical protein